MPISTLSICKCTMLFFCYLTKWLWNAKVQVFILGDMRGGFSLNSSKNSLLAWTGHSPWTACPRLSWVMACVSAELATSRRWKASFPQLSTPVFDAEIPDPASSGMDWNPEVFHPFLQYSHNSSYTHTTDLRAPCESRLTKLINLVRALYCSLSLLSSTKGQCIKNIIWKTTVAVTASWFLVLAIKLVTTACWC